MHDDTEDMPALQNTTPLENTPPTHSIPKQDGEWPPTTIMTPTLNMI